MKKYRIKKEVIWDKELFYIEEKCLFFWIEIWAYRLDIYMRVSYETLDKAKQRIKKLEDKQNIKIYYYNL